MKKLMIAVAIVCAAAFANAGAVRWIAQDVPDVVGEEAFEGGMAYLFTAAVAADAVEAAILDGSFATKYASQAIYTTSFEEGGFDTGAILSGEYSGDTTLWMAAIDDTGTPANYMIGDPVMQTIGTSGTKKFEYTYGDNLTSWQSVPEPTSGLLLLLGVAGLALRRRRA